MRQVRPPSAWTLTTRLNEDPDGPTWAVCATYAALRQIGEAYILDCGDIDTIARGRWGRLAPIAVFPVPPVA